MTAAIVFAALTSTSAGAQSVGDAETTILTAATTLGPGRPDAADSLATRVISEFPADSRLHIAVSNALADGRYHAPALILARRAIAASPGLGAAHVQLALVFTKAGRTDSAMVTIGRAVAANGDKVILAQIALKAGSEAYGRGNASKSQQDLDRAFRILMLSHRLHASSDAQFLAGASAFLIGQSSMSEAERMRSCPPARLAEQSLMAAEENVPAGLRDYSDAAAQMLSAIVAYKPAVADQIRQFCK